jgi:CheY-like chemotaxis protein
MCVIAIFSSEHSHGDEIADSLARELSYRRIDDELLGSASRRFGVSSGDLKRAMEGPPFVFNKFTHKRERIIAYLRAVLAELLKDDNLVLHGFASLLVPRDILHVLRVCLVADPEYRVRKLVESGRPEKSARSAVRESDMARSQWTQYLFKLPPWDRSLYDIKVPMCTMSVDKSVSLIRENAGREAFVADERGRTAVEDFQTGARAGLALVEAGHYHDVAARDRVVTVTVDQYVLRFEHLEGELKKALAGVEGVSDVEVKTGPNYRPTSVFANVDFELPDKVLLVDDEKEFVLTLSERLQMRDLAPAVAYNGEEALSILKEEEPEVIVLDLKMPGIDGIEVLRKVRKEHPEVEVIILTGHGSEKDRELCMQLGAFAYLEKPVDIEELSKTMKEANERIKSRRKQKS